MHYDFHEKLRKTIYKTLLDSFFNIFFSFPIVTGGLFGIIILLNLYDFYVKIAEAIHKDYVDDKHIHSIKQHLKNLTGFREEVINVANSSAVVATIDKFLNLDYDGQFTYGEI